MRSIDTRSTFFRRAKASPNPRRNARRDVERVAGLDLESRVPAVNVPDHAVHPISRRRVWIGDEPLPQRLVANLLAPHLRPPQEYPLVAGETIDDRCRSASQAGVICIEGQR